LIFDLRLRLADTCPFEVRGHVDTKPETSGAATTLQFGCSCIEEWPDIGVIIYENRLKFAALMPIHDY
jgi:hypothetical protein